nr:MAG TPA: hypothetical protein [Caudoviricetes sp.]
MFFHFSYLFIFFFLTHYLYGLVTVYLFWWCDVELL